MDRDLVERVTGATLVVLVPAVIGGGFLAGWRGAVGVLSGALISLASFRWVAHAGQRAARLLSGGRPGALWVLALGFRQTTMFGLIALLVWSGSAHPAALVAGLSLLPPILIAFGLRASRATA